MVCWINGQLQLQPQTSVYDRALQFGDGLFETVRISDGNLTLAERHWHRLKRGCQRLDINLPSKLFSHLDEFLRSLNGGTGRLKIVISRGESHGGYGYDDSVEPNYYFFFSEVTDQLLVNQQRGISVFQCKHPLLINPALAGIKHLNRLDQVLAMREWQSQGFQEGLVCDLEGNIIEGCFSNIFWVQEGQLCTPDLGGSGVDGVMRQYILDAFSERQPVRIAPLLIEQLKQADECFLCNSVYGVWPIKAYQNKSWRPCYESGSFTERAIKLANDVLGIS